MHINKYAKIKLILEDNTILTGASFGANKPASGEVVFNTGMVGYPEALTDPSYRGQILVLTYPLIGNYGVPLAISNLKTQISNLHLKSQNLLKTSLESEKIQIAGLVVSEYCAQHSHPCAKQSLGEGLKSEGVPAIEGVDTRALTQKLRKKGTMLGIISKIKNQKSKIQIKNQKFNDPNERNLAAEVSCAKPIIYEPKIPNTKHQILNTILLYDCGVKLSIIRSLLRRGCRVIRVPWNFPISQFPPPAIGFAEGKWRAGNFPISSLNGIVISNGPGDPTKCDKTIEQIFKLLFTNYQLPILGICLGNQILALAAGAKTYKLKYGHRGQNQPVIEKSKIKNQKSKTQIKIQNDEHKNPNYQLLITNYSPAFITSQNHGYAIDEKTLPKDWSVWFKNLNDDTIEGIRHKTKPYMAVQFHPEAAPGPTDTEWIFDEWLRLL